MAYTAIDLLDKIIYTGGKNKSMYDDSLEKLQKNTPNYLVIKVISKNLGISVEYYKKLKEETHNIDLEEIDFIIYDKISFLINEFTYKIILDTRDIKSSIESYLNFQRNVLALFISIQGGLVKKEKDINTKVYEILGNIIKEKKKNIDKIEEFIKSYC
jgi:hypothetical protein